MSSEPAALLQHGIPFLPPSKTVVSIYTVSGKKVLLYFHYNFRKLLAIFIIIVPLETEMDTPQSRVIYLFNSLITL